MNYSNLGLHKRPLLKKEMIGESNGVAGLDENGKVPTQNLPALTSDLSSLEDTNITTPQNNEVLSYNDGKWVNASINKTDLGLNNVDNTSDLNKPVSTATQNALNGKENADTTILKQGDINNTLTSTSTTHPLSANQGKVLKGLVDGKISDIAQDTSPELGGNLDGKNKNISNITKLYLSDRIEKVGDSGTFLHNGSTRTWQFYTNSVKRAMFNNSGLTLESGTAVNEFSTDTSLSGNSNNAVPTEKAVKTYIDNKFTTLTLTTKTATIRYIGSQFISNFLNTASESRAFSTSSPLGAQYYSVMAVILPPNATKILKWNINCSGLCNVSLSYSTRNTDVWGTIIDDSTATATTSFYNDTLRSVNYTINSTYRYLLKVKPNGDNYYSLYGASIEYEYQEI